MPNLAVGTRGQVRSALRFLGLTDAADTVSSRFHDLVQAFGSDKWQTQVRAVIDLSYKPVIGEFDFKNGTSSQLEKRFRENGGVTGQMMEKSIRFYLSALEAAGANISPHLTARQVRSNGGSKSTKRKRRVEEDQREEEEIVITVGHKTLVFPAGSGSVKIVMPDDLDAEHWAIIDATVRGYIKIGQKGH
jgi:hypothetical protein